MRFDVAPEPITDGDEVIEAGVSSALPAPMLAAVAHLTGDLSVLHDDLRPDLSQSFQPDGGYSPDQVAEARELAAQALIAQRQRNQVAPPPGEADARRLIEFVAGDHLEDDVLPLYQAELAVDGADLRAPDWHLDDLAPGTTLRAVVVGAGMSGIIVAHRLDQAGVEVEVIEKNDGIGGTWFENDYPGCRVDIQNHFYSYACAQTPDWPQFHSPQPVLLEYFTSCVEQFGLRDKIRLRTEVLAARFDEEAGQWEVTTRSPEGRVATTRADLLVSATGQLNRPHLPEIPGIGDFAGPSFHSARWDADVELAGARVAVIGSGASAVQFIPPVAEEAAELTIFQRTPPWLLPVPTYQQDVGPDLRWLLRHLPQFAHFDRLSVFARTQEGLLPLATVDPDWDGDGRSVSESNDLLRQLLTGFYEAAFPDSELRATVLPTYPPIAKRVVLDDGTYAAALSRPNVRIESTPIASVVREGLRTTDGALHEADVIIYGTGFQASKFLTPMEVVGRDGRDLHGHWGGDARAHLGITVPGFPNLFLLYGPNTNIVINGSITYFSECQAQYITDCARLLASRGARSMDCRPEVHDRYNAEIDEGNGERAWGASDVHTWYRNEHGRIAQNWPFDLVRYWRQTRAVDPAEYVLR